MKHFPAIVAVAACAIFALAAPVAHADSSYGPLTVTVWTGTGVTDQADMTNMPSGTPNFTFTYNGPLDFTTSNPANTFADFFGSNVSGISSFTVGTESALLADTMSTVGETGPGVINSYLSFTGTYTGGGAVSVSHDDGASLYTGAGYTNTVFSSPAPTDEIASLGTLPTGTDVPFDLVYVESNGEPSDLVVTGLTPTPEPGTIGLMALGLISLAAVAYRGGVLGS